MTDRSPINSSDTIYLDMIGGIAGDMFLAACCDLEREFIGLCDETLRKIADLPQDLRIEFRGSDSSGELGASFRVWRQGGAPANHAHSHMSFREVRRIVGASELSRPVRERADDIFENLARCESKVHGVSMDEVVFHEVGGWDSIVDVILAATIIDALNKCTWIAGPVPMGRGPIDCAHGLIPAPAPATAELLQGFVVHQDEFKGERVTPTGAALLRHLQPQQVSGLPQSRLLAFGSGYGSKRIEGCTNVLRCYWLDQQIALHGDDVAVIEFDIDDQSPEDLALGIESVRSVDGVLDVVQTSFVGKKNRLGSTVRVIASWDQAEHAADACLAATSTLGVRWHRATRRILTRYSESSQFGKRKLDIKQTKRPDGHVTAKIESNDLAGLGESYGERELIRAEVTAQKSKRDT